MRLYFVPIRKNPYNGQFELLVSFDLKFDVQQKSIREVKSTYYYSDRSVLANGNWYKFSTQVNGIYKITYQDLVSMGLDPTGIDPRNIRIYGNGGGMLPESSDDFRYDDLQEDAIQVIGESDGHFDAGDYILFYGQSPHQWKYSHIGQYFNHILNIYSEKTFYFLTSDLGPGKRIAGQPSTTNAATTDVNTFTDYAYHEVDEHNLVNVGRTWYGEIFDTKTTYDFPFSFPNLVPGSQAYFKGYVAAKSNIASSFIFQCNGTEIMRGTIQAIPETSASAYYAHDFFNSQWFSPNGSDLDIKVIYQKSTNNSIGWLNYLELNVTRALVFTGGEMSFRNPYSVGPGNVSNYTLSNSNPQVTIWNVTDPVNVKKVLANQNGNSQTFRLENDSLLEFIAFDQTNFHQVSFDEKIANQNLHGLTPPDMIIISNPLFLDQAERLAQYHRTRDNLSVEVVDLTKIYNEFSSGAQDISAIRNFVKMLYDKADPSRGTQIPLAFRGRFL